MFKNAPVFACAALFTLCTAAANADPVTAVYQIDVIQRFDYQQQTLEPFSSSFELTLSFDGSSSLSETADRAVREYGAPLFSAVPDDLVIAEPPAGLSTVDHALVRDEWWASDGGYRRTSLARAELTDESLVGNLYRAGIVLTAPSSLVLPSPPPLTTASMLENFGMGNAIAFLYTGYAVTGSDAQRMFADNSYQYQGFATLVRFDIPGGEQPPAVPEPASMLLAAAGLAVLRGVRGRTRRRSIS